MGAGAGSAPNNIFRGVSSGAELEGLISATGSGRLNFVTDTATNIADVAAAINTTNKATGKMVWDTTNNRLLRASGSAAASDWHVVDGSVTVTPA